MTATVTLSPRVSHLADELAARRGTTRDAAVETALREALDRESVRPDLTAAIADLRAMVADTSDQWLTDEGLYDSEGLPR